MLNKCTLLALTAIALFVVVPAHAVHVQPVCFAGAPSTIPSCLRGRATNAAAWPRRQSRTGPAAGGDVTMALRKPIVGGNWKCNPAETAKLPELVANFGPCADLLDKCDVYVCPSNLHVGMIYKDFAPGIMVAPQNCNFKGCGAYTGEMAVDQMVDMGLKVRNTRHACTHAPCSYPHKQAPHRITASNRVPTDQNSAA